MTGTRYQNCMARMFVSESDTIQYSRKAKRRPEVMQWFSRYFCGNYWLEKGEAADWLFACILRKIDVWTATWSQCWSMLDSLNKCYGQWVRILASMAGRNFLDTAPQQSIENDIISIFQMETFSTSEICLNCCSTRIRNLIEIYSFSSKIQCLIPSTQKDIFYFSNFSNHRERRLALGL